MSNTKTNFMDRMTEFMAAKVMPPMTKFANLRPLRVIRDAMMATIPMIVASSVFLILYMLGSPLTYEEGAKPLIGFLAPFAGQLLVVYTYCLAFVSIYVAVAIGIAFSKVYETQTMSTALISLGSFFAITVNNSGTAGFDASGLFACFVGSFIGCFTLKYFTDHKLTIKLPDTVPQLIIDSFAAIIPWFVAIAICWFIRVVLNFDLVTFFATTIGPIFNLGDTPIGYAVYMFLMMLFWSFGIHGYNVLSPVVEPLATMWGAENTAAAAAGVALTKLPHVWAYNFPVLNEWIGGIYPLLIYMLLSRRKENREFGRTMIVPTMFLCEPLMFGAPVVMNPIFFIPMIISAVLSGFVSHLIMGLGFINRFFVSVSWTVPWPILFPLSNGGDLKIFLIPLVSLLIGMIVWYPFFKIYEKNQEKEELELNK